MARDKKIIIGAVNITIQPHSPQLYLELFKDVYKLKTPVTIHGEQCALLAGMYRLDRDQEEPGPISGDIFKFTNIDMTAQWFNIETSDFANKEDLGKVNIPENLKPNSSRFSYIFFPKQHLFFYEGYYDGKTFAPANAERFLERQFSHPEIIEKYGRIDVTHVPAIDALNEALQLPVKERIEMVIKRPNPDDHAEAERRVMERMRTRNVATFEQKYKAVSGESIEMDEELRTMAHISAKNGSFSVKGKGADSKPVEFSTTTHPWRQNEYYDPDLESPFELFSRIAVEMKDVITEWFRR